MTGLQQTLAITLRTLIGCHFAYAGPVKLILPSWTRDGTLGRHAARYVKELGLFL